MQARLAVREAERRVRRAQYRAHWREAAIQTGILAWYLATFAFVTHHVINDARAVTGRPPWRRF